MSHDVPHWAALKACAEQLAHQGSTPFTRSQLIAAVQARYPGRGEGSLNPILQGMTVNLQGGARSAGWKAVFRSVGRGLFELLEAPQADTERETTVAPLPDKVHVVRDRVTLALPQPQRERLNSSQAIDRPLVLVSCVKSKRAVPSLAEDLYRSALFTKAKQYAKTRGRAWFILSAKYGLVEPQALLEPYELTLKTMSAAERRAWANSVFAALQAHLRPGERVVLLAGQSYRTDLVPLLEAHGCTVETPLAHIPGLGAQQNWLEDASRST